MTCFTFIRATFDLTFFISISSLGVSLFPQDLVTAATDLKADFFFLSFSFSTVGPTLRESSRFDLPSYV